MADTPDASGRIIILAPVGRDAELTAKALESSGLPCTVAGGIDDLCSAIDSGIGATILTSETLQPAALRKLEEVLGRQPAWSEIPVMIFIAGGGSEGRAAGEIALPRAQVMLVERPIHLRFLVSTARAALRSRARQYEVRDLLERERQHAERLEGLAHASLSIASALSLPDVIEMITAQARTLTGAGVALTCVAAENAGSEPITSLAFAEEYREWEPRLRAWREGVTAVAETVPTPTRLRLAELRRDDRRVILRIEGVQPIARDLMATPLLDAGRGCAGFLALWNKEGSDAGFGSDDELVLTQLAQMASAAVQRARLYREAQEANRAKDDFLATLAHELRTPMTSILGWVQTLKEDDVPRELAESAIQMIEASTRVQAVLVEDLMDVSRIIAGKLRITPEPMEIAPVIESVVTTFRPAAEEKGVVLAMEADTDPLSVWGDPVRIRQIIWNVLSNAVKFTPEGGRIAVRLERDHGDAVIRVRDTGSGISADFLPYLFERFRQAETGTARSHGGLGLGLAIVKHLVETHGGTVEARSDGPGKGAEFTLRLPIRVLRPEEGEEPERSDLEILEGKRVLVVDDDSSARATIVEMFRDLGTDARAVASVSEALDVAASMGPDLIISDIAMPGEDGYALVRRLQEIEQRIGRGIPSLALTGYGRPDDRMRVLTSGFQRYVQKPASPRELAKAAADLLRS